STDPPAKKLRVIEMSSIPASAQQYWHSNNTGAYHDPPALSPDDPESLQILKTLAASSPHPQHSIVDAYTPAEAAHLLVSLGAAKAKEPIDHLFLKAFLAGVYLSFGGLLYITVGGGSAGLNATNPGIVRLLEGLVFPVGLFLIVITGTELFTGNCVTFTVSTLAGHTTLYDLIFNLTIAFIGNLAGSLFFAGILVYYADSTALGDPYKHFLITTAGNKVNTPGWHQIFLRAISCNWLVCLAIYIASMSKDVISKLVVIYVIIGAFISLAFEHVVANFFLLPLAMMVGQGGQPFSVGKYIWKSVVPVTIGNLVGGCLFVGVPVWYLYIAGPAPWHRGRKGKQEPGTGEGGPTKK
ncbi:hypothetical protein YB2330_006311, partial [Saitoella coloradoensis]